jgi:alpha-L-rhamnosidase
MDQPGKALWLQDPRFAGLVPRDLLHKQAAATSLPPHDPSLQNVHMLVRKTFDLPGDVATASLAISADDYYHLYINGHFVGQGPAPAYHFHYNVNTWDVTARLVAGRNVLAVQVYYQGLCNRVWNSADYRQGMFAELTVTTKAGRQIVVPSDDTWRMRISPAWRTSCSIGYDTQFAEDVDGRLLEPGWRETGFDDSAWTRPAAHELRQTDYTFVPQSTPPLAVYDAWPALLRHVAAGRYLADFGREITARISMRVHGPAGHRVEVRYGEELSGDGSARYQMRCNCLYRDIWTLAGLPQETIEFFDYKGFRYVEVLNMPGDLDAGDIRAIVRHYPFDAHASGFRSSHPVLDDIWSLCANAVRDCCQETVVDCPTREKGQYINDAFVTAHSQMLLTGDTRLARKVLEDAALSAGICPGLMAVAPGSVMQEMAEASLLWPALLWEYYQHSGDEAFLKQMLPVLDGLMHYFQRHENATGLLEDVCEKWNLVDWPASCRDGYDFDLSNGGGQGCQAVLNAHYYRMVETCSRVYQAAGLDAEPLDRKRKALREAFVRTFRNARSGLFVDAVGSNHASLHASAMALCAGLVPVETQFAVVSFLRSKGMACGVWFANFLLQGLIAAGQADLAFDLMVADEPHSWRNMLQEGATACMEVWGADQKWNTSFCHAWASSPVVLLVEEFLGIAHALPGWQAIRIQPRMPRALKSVSLHLTLPQGRLSATYGRSERMEMYSLYVPPEVRVLGPDSAKGWQVRTADKNRGAYLFERPGNRKE